MIIIISTNLFGISVAYERIFISSTYNSKVVVIASVMVDCENHKNAQRKNYCCKAFSPDPVFR